MNEFFFSKKDHHGGEHESASQREGSSGGHSGSEQKDQNEESITPGPRRLVDVVFSPGGDELYVVDFGSMVVTKEVIPIRRTGVIWRITRDGHVQNERAPWKNGPRPSPQDNTTMADDELIENRLRYALE